MGLCVSQESIAVPRPAAAAKPTTRKVAIQAKSPRKPAATTRKVANHVQSPRKPVETYETNPVATDTVWPATILTDPLYGHHDHHHHCNHVDPVHHGGFDHGAMDCGGHGGFDGGGHGGFDGGGFDGGGSGGFH